MLVAGAFNPGELSILSASDMATMLPAEGWEHQYELADVKPLPSVLLSGPRHTVPGLGAGPSSPAELLEHPSLTFHELPPQLGAPHQGLRMPAASASMAMQVLRSSQTEAPAMLSEVPARACAWPCPTLQTWLAALCPPASKRPSCRWLQRRACSKPLHSSC